MSNFNIKFCEPFVAGNTNQFIDKLFDNTGNFLERNFLNQCKVFFENKFKSNVLVTNTCTSALEIVALSENLGLGDEVIMPSFTYVSTANAFAKFGVTPVFVDISSSDLNINARLIEDAITEKTKAIVVVHYAGVACELNTIHAICKEKNLLLIEDAAHGYNSRYDNLLLGTVGDYGAISFDHTKNIHCGQGGLLLIKEKLKVSTATNVYENGTNKFEYFEKNVPYFEWVNNGSKYYLSDLNAALLLSQVEQEADILSKRMTLWKYYHHTFINFNIGEVELPYIPNYATHNAHIYHIRLKDGRVRNKLQEHLGKSGIEANFHFIPLHSSLHGKKVGRFHGTDEYTTKESERILRLPLHNRLTYANIDFIVSEVRSFFTK